VDIYLQNDLSLPQLKHLKGSLPWYLPDPFFSLLTNFASISSGSESSFLSALNDASLEVGLSLTILISYAVNVPRS
jgi:hypothetical protein